MLARSTVPTCFVFLQLFPDTILQLGCPGCFFLSLPFSGHLEILTQLPLATTAKAMKPHSLNQP
jgi:hypothetical protein